MSLVDRGRTNVGGSEGYPQLNDPASFRRATVAYAKAYQQIITALYEDEGLTPPDRTITLGLSPEYANVAGKAADAAPETRQLAELQAVPSYPSFSEIAGQDKAVAEAKRLVLAINHPEVFERRGVKRPKGVLFYGPPGTGKTMIARAVAEEASAVFLEVSAADIGTKWYGESERLMQGIFDQANIVVNSGGRVVIFFDELDALAPSRDNSHEATQKVVATLLKNMDGISSNRNVTIIAATNRPEGIDEAVRRAGRFDKRVLVGLPDQVGREHILDVHMARARRVATAPDELFAPDIDLSVVAQITSSASGADLANLINLTLEEKVMEELQGATWTPVTEADLIRIARKLSLVEEPPPPPVEEPPPPPVEEPRRLGF